MTHAPTSMWGGRFEAGSDPLFKAFNDSLPFDHRLVYDDVAGSQAWARALLGAGVLTVEEAARIDGALAEIAEQAASDPEAVARAGDEDIHTWVEAQLIARVGDLGKKLHTGRSRNDQVATDLRLWTRRENAARRAEIRAAQRALLELGEREIETVLPGYTHLQRAQPVLFAHWCLAYFEMLERDHERFADADRRTAMCPLGAGALAGTAYPIDRRALADDLAFDGPTANSLDAVSDRDFVVETLAAAALCSTHLSRLAEDLVFYGSGEARFIELDDSMTSGSSMMPQKKNPDALELVRGKSGRLIGALVSLFTTLKGLPLAYNKDMQEDKTPLFDAMATLSLCLQVVPPVLDRLRVDRARTAEAAAGDYANATELADYLVARGVPFRAAHDAVGAIVRHAIELGAPLEAVPIDDLRKIAPEIEDDVRACLSIEATLAKRDVIGGTAPNRVRDALQQARSRLSP